MHIRVALQEVFKGRSFEVGEVFSAHEEEFFRSEVSPGSRNFFAFTE